MLKRLQDNNSIISNFVKVNLPIYIQKAEPNIDWFCVILKWNELLRRFDLKTQWSYPKIIFSYLIL